MRIFPKYKNNPAIFAKLYSYRSGVVNNLTRSLAMLGLDKAPAPVGSLEELFAEESSNEPQSTAATEAQADGANGETETD